MSNTSLPENFDSMLAAQPVELPVFHPVALHLQRMLADKNFSVLEVAELVSDDQALASRMLELANSPFYAGRAKIATIKEAITRLGAQQVINIAFAASQSAVHASLDRQLNVYLEELWLHSHASALGARHLAYQCGMLELADEIYLGGLLHDVGKLFLLVSLDQLFKKGALEAMPDQETMTELLTAHHVAQGYRLVSFWNFPEMYCEIIRDHHVTQYDSLNRALAIVRFVNRACHSLGLGMQKELGLDLLALPECELLGVNQVQVDELVVLLLESSLCGRTIT